MFDIGESQRLQLQGPLYVGGLDPSMESYRVPPAIWSASLRKGFVGCLRDMVINGLTIDVAEIAARQDSGKYLYINF